MASKIIVIDPGHFAGYNKGVVNDYREGNGNLLACMELKRALEAYGFVVYMTRVDGKDLSLDARGKVAIAKRADVFISWHSDANAKSSIRGVTAILSLKTASGRALAEKLAAATAKTMQTPLSPYGAAKNGVMSKAYNAKYPKLDWYGVLRAATGKGHKLDAAILLENSFHTNATDCAYLDNSARRKELVAAQALCIAEHYGMATKPAKRYKVTVSPASEGDKNTIVKQAQALGLPVIVTEV